MYNDGRGDQRAVYKDGTWIGVAPDAPGYSEDSWTEYSYDLDPQEEYYKTLLRRYNALRATLANANLNELAQLMEAEPSRFTNVKPPRNRKEWLYTLEHEYPTPVRVLQMDDRDLYRGLGYCADILDRFETISKEKSCWVWTLLASAGEPGTLDYSRVGRIRDLGYKAGRLNVQLHGGAPRRPPSEKEEVDVEDWDTDGEGTGGEDSDGAAEDDVNASEASNPEHLSARVEKVSEPEEEVNERGKSRVSSQSPSEGNGHDIITAQGDGSDEPKTDDAPQKSIKEEENDGDADISMSEDEGEVNNDEPESTDLEEARARLLAQLGDRLVQPFVPEFRGSRSSRHREGPEPSRSSPPKRGPRHRHNGKVCHNPLCEADERRRTSHQKAGPRMVQMQEAHHQPSSTLSDRKLLCRAEAELQRRQMREKELNKAEQEEQADAVEAPPASEGVLHLFNPIAETPKVEDQNPSNPPCEAEKPHEQLNQKTIAAEIVQEVDSVPNDTDSEMEDIHPVVDLNTRVTLDMILTVVAECYGQKDLLRFREVW